MENISIFYIGLVFKNARHSVNLTQEEFAEKIGVTTRYITTLENEGKLRGFPTCLPPYEKILFVFKRSKTVLVKK